MGIPSILAGALKKVPWTTLMMNYGPEIMRRLGGKIQIRDVEPEEHQVNDQAEERIRELQALFDEQRALNLRQQEQIEQLTRTCSSLDVQVKRYRVIAVSLGVTAAVLCIVLLFNLSG